MAIREKENVVMDQHEQRLDCPRQKFLFRAGTHIRIQTGQTTFFQIISIELRNKDGLPLVTYEFFKQIYMIFLSYKAFLRK